MHHGVYKEEALEQQSVEAVEGYCVKCRAKRKMENARRTQLKNGKPATEGTCPVCGTRMFRIGG